MIQNSKETEDAAIEQSLRFYLTKCWNYKPEEAVKTAARVRKFAEEWKDVAENEPELYFEDGFNSDEMVVIDNISYNSMCEHHMLPFFGRCVIAYMPSEKGVLGVSKFARIVKYFAQRPQLQERLTTQIGEYLIENLGTQDVAVYMTGQHTCAMIRGVAQPNMNFVTQFLHGKFRESADTRNEFISLAKR